MPAQVKEKAFALGFLLVVAGCGGPNFTNLGNGAGVPANTLSQRAIEQNLSRPDARMQLRTESEQRRVEEHARLYGITVGEAQRQLAHARQMDTN